MEREDLKLDPKSAKAPGNRNIVAMLKLNFCVSKKWR